MTDHTNEPGLAVRERPTGDDRPRYRDSSLPPEARAADLLSRMTLEEKAAQMVGVWQLKSETLVDADGAFDLAKARAAFGHGHGLGQVGRPSDAGGSGSGGGGVEPLKGRN